MNLKLSVGDKVLASIAVDPNKGKDEYYLKAFRRLLIIRYHKPIAALKKEPHFFIELPPVNTKTYSRP